MEVLICPLPLSDPWQGLMGPLVTAMWSSSNDMGAGGCSWHCRQLSTQCANTQMGSSRAILAS